MSLARSTTTDESPRISRNLTNGSQSTGNSKHFLTFYLVHGNQEDLGFIALTNNILRVIFSQLLLAIVLIKGVLDF